MDFFKETDETPRFVEDEADLSFSGELGFFSFWILATGYWNDGGIWVDEEVWKDG